MDDGENPGQNGSVPCSAISGNKKFLSGSLMQDNVPSAKKATGDGDRYRLSYAYVIV